MPQPMPLHSLADLLERAHGLTEALYRIQVALLGVFMTLPSAAGLIATFFPRIRYRIAILYFAIPGTLAIAALTALVLISVARSA